MPRAKKQEAVQPVAEREWPSLGYINFYSMAKSNRKQGNESFTISARWRNANCNSGPTEAEAIKAGAKWGYKVTFDELDGYAFSPLELAPEGTRDG